MNLSGPGLRAALMVLIMSAAAPSAASATETELTLEAIPGPLAWELGVPDFTLMPDGLQLRPKRGDDLYTSVDGEDHIHRAPLLLFQPSEQFVLIARIGFTSTAPYDGGALVVYSDRQNWTKYLFENLGSGAPGVVMNAVTGGLGDVAYYAELPRRQAWLAIISDGRQLFFHRSTTGEKWYLDRVMPAPRFPNLRVGFEAQAPNSDNVEVSFSRIVYRPRAPDNPWSLN